MTGDSSWACSSAVRLAFIEHETPKLIHYVAHAPADFPGFYTNAAEAFQKRRSLVFGIVKLLMLGN
jgi:hypothetical protein